MIHDLSSSDLTWKEWDTSIYFLESPPSAGPSAGHVWILPLADRLFSPSHPSMMYRVLLRVFMENSRVIFTMIQPTIEIHPAHCGFVVFIDFCGLMLDWGIQSTEPSF